MKKTLQNQKGQGLVEYLLLVALMAVGTIGVVRTLSYVTQAKFGNAIYAIEGTDKKVQFQKFDESTVRKKDMSDFMNGAAARDK
jgi:pilus assembly protein Flp/PilA